MATTIYSEVTTAQLSGGGGGSSGTVVGPFYSANTQSTSPGLGSSGFGYGTAQGGSVVGMSITLASGQTGTTSVAVYKNGALLVTAFSGTSFSASARSATVTFASGTYTYIANDVLTVVVTAQSTAYTLTAFVALSAF